MKTMSKPTRLMLQFLIAKATGVTPYSEETLQLFFNNEWLLTGLQKEFEKLNLSAQLSFSNAQANCGNENPLAKVSIRGRTIGWVFHKNIHVASLIKNNDITFFDDVD